MFALYHRFEFFSCKTFVFNISGKHLLEGCIGGLYRIKNTKNFYRSYRNKYQYSKQSVESWNRHNHIWGGSGPNSTPSYYSVQFHVYRLLIAPSIIDNLNTIDFLEIYFWPPICFVAIGFPLSYYNWNYFCLNYCLTQIASDVQCTHSTNWPIYF